MHEGHREFFRDARIQGDSLTAIVISDEGVYQNKSRYPVNNQQQRMEAVKRIGLVDAVLIAPTTGQLELMASLKPDVFVFGYDQQTEWERELKQYLRERGLNTEFYVSQEFAGGVHSRHLRTT